MSRKLAKSLSRFFGYPLRMRDIRKIMCKKCKIIGPADLKFTRDKENHIFVVNRDRKKLHSFGHLLRNKIAEIIAKIAQKIARTIAKLH